MDVVEPAGLHEPGGGLNSLVAEETRDPRRNVPLAVVGSVVISGLLYVFGSYAIVTAFGPDQMKRFAADPNPFATAARTYLPLLTPVIAWVFLSSVTSSYVAANTQASRVIFGGARGGLWPSVLARVSPRFQTPWVAVTVFVVPSLLIAVISTAFTDPGTAAGFLGTLGILGPVVMYIVTNIALIVQYVKLRRSGQSRSAVWWVVTPVIGLLVLAIPVWGDLRPGQDAPYNALPWLTLGLIALGVVYTMILARRQPGVMAQAPALLEGAESTDEVASTRRAG